MQMNAQNPRRYSAIASYVYSVVINNSDRANKDRQLS